MILFYEFFIVVGRYFVLILIKNVKIFFKVSSKGKKTLFLYEINLISLTAIYA